MKTTRSSHILPVAVLAALAAASCAGPEGGPATSVPSEPYPLGPAMALLERDTRSDEYRQLLRGESSNLNVLNAEWQRVGVADNAREFQELHGGPERVGADPALRAAHERRLAIEKRFLEILREEYAFRGQKAPFDEDARVAEGPAPAGSRADPALAIEPILPAPGAQREWPRWRGPTGQGLSAERDLPERFGATENIAWKTPIPGSGNSSPVIWGDRIFLTAASEQGKRRSLVAVRRSDGALLFTSDMPAVEPEGRVIAKNGYASATPATDGERVVCFFGNAGIAAFDLDGKLLWRHPLPPFDAMHGTGASPVLAGELAILFQEQSSKPSLGVALDKRTGQPRWQVELPPALGWCTPLALRIGGRDQLVYGASKAVIAFDPATGKEIWRCAGPTHEVIPTVVAGHGLIYSASGRVGPTLAIRPQGEGDITRAALAWSQKRGGPHVPSPLLSGDLLYQVNDMGIVSCLRAATGEILYQKRLGGKFSASPVAGDGKVYLTSEEGDVTVLRDGPEFAMLSTNSLGEYTLASPAIRGGQLFFRTRSHLLAVGARAGAAAAAAR